TPMPRGSVAFDIGTGTGVLAAVLARRGGKRVIATDMDPRALACARENLDRRGLSKQVDVEQADPAPYTHLRAHETRRQPRCRAAAWPSISAPAPACWRPCWRAAAASASSPPTWTRAPWP
ncbi:50S ribosomal protein L11 methyltransferase, partial [Escherichia coli]